jgi:hypothetical protein
MEKMIPVESVPGMGRWRVRRRMVAGFEFKYDMFDIS